MDELLTCDLFKLYSGDKRWHTNRPCESEKMKILHKMDIKGKKLNTMHTCEQNGIEAELVTFE